MSSNNEKIKISMIAAMASESRVIGKIGGGIPWHIKEDLKYFKEKTTGHPIIMGRRTWEEFGGRPLPNRTHIIVTHDKNYPVPVGHFVINSIEVAIQKAIAIEKGNSNDYKEIFIVGGEKIYELGIIYADRIYLTIVDIPTCSEININSSAKFPDYEKYGFIKKLSSRFSQDDNFKYEFVVLERE